MTPPDRVGPDAPHSVRCEKFKPGHHLYLTQVRTVSERICNVTAMVSGLHPEGGVWVALRFPDGHTERWWNHDPLNVDRVLETERPCEWRTTGVLIVDGEAGLCLSPHADIVNGCSSTRADAGDIDVGTALAAATGLRLHNTHAEPLAEELAHLLDRLIADRHTFFIAEIEGGRRYVQYIAQEGDWIRGESVGNRFLDEPERLSAIEQRELELLRWNPPETDSGDCGNYWRMWEPPDIFDAAQLAALTLCRVHHLVAPGHATLKAARAATYEAADEAS